MSDRSLRIYVPVYGAGTASTSIVNDGEGELQWSVVRCPAWLFVGPPGGRIEGGGSAAITIMALAEVFAYEGAAGDLVLTVGEPPHLETVHVTVVEPEPPDPQPAAPRRRRNRMWYAEGNALPLFVDGSELSHMTSRQIALDWYVPVGRSFVQIGGGPMYQDAAGDTEDGYWELYVNWFMVHAGYCLSGNDPGDRVASYAVAGLGIAIPGSESHFDVREGAIYDHGVQRPAWGLMPYLQATAQCYPVRVDARLRIGPDVSEAWSAYPQFPLPSVLEAAKLELWLTYGF